ncbi:HET-domain-containing protein, partial [Amniculicola lignicola CBS 123094]
MDYFNPSVAVPHQPFIVSSLAGGLKFVRLIQPDSIDFNIVSEWLDFCKSNHPECIERSVSINVENLRLIDCNNRRIVPACNHQYVSLSYVWGAPTKGTRVEDFTQVLPDDLPDTIEHSILATRALGFRYLWIDRYCIDRRDRTVFEAQLQQMGMIYKNSILTIVATAGNNDAYGLPGVGARHRRPQPFAHVDEHFLVSSMSDPTSLIKTSIWRTRGWTYQEGCLSTRRLFFTDEHVYYECQGSFHSE